MTIAHVAAQPVLQAENRSHDVHAVLPRDRRHALIGLPTGHGFVPAVVGAAGVDTPYREGFRQTGNVRSLRRGFVEQFLGLTQVKLMAFLVGPRPLPYLAWNRRQLSPNEPYSPTPRSQVTWHKPDRFHFAAESVHEGPVLALYKKNQGSGPRSPGCQPVWSTRDNRDRPANLGLGPASSAGLPAPLWRLPRLPATSHCARCR